MAARHIFNPLALPVPIRIRNVTSQGKFPRPINHGLRNFTSGSFLEASSKRRLQTSTAPTFVSPTLLPQITEISDRSKIGVQMQSSGKSTDQYNSIFELSSGQRSNTSFLGEETPETKSRAALKTQTEIKSRPKLRARKAAIKLAPAAVKQLKKLSDQPSPKLIKIGVRNRGCSGLAYHLEYVEKSGLLDEEVEQDGVKVIIDSKALFSIIGSEMDWVEDKLNQRFVFKNPNIKEQCGCGESFMV